MKNFKRILALVLAVVMVTGISASLSAADAWYQDAVTYLENTGIATIGTMADEKITRNEFVLWVAKLETRQLDDSGQRLSARAADPRRLPCRQHPQHLAARAVKSRRLPPGQQAEFLGREAAGLHRRFTQLQHGIPVPFLQACRLHGLFYQRGPALCVKRGRRGRHPRSAPARWALRCTGRPSGRRRWAAY